MKSMLQRFLDRLPSPCDANWPFNRRSLVENRRLEKRERERVTRVVGATLGSRVETPQTATSRKGATRGRDAEREVRAAFLLPICELLI